MSLDEYVSKGSYSPLKALTRTNEALGSVIRSALYINTAIYFELGRALVHKRDFSPLMGPSNLREGFCTAVGYTLGLPLLTLQTITLVENPELSLVPLVTNMATSLVETIRKNRNDFTSSFSH